MSRYKDDLDFLLELTINGEEQDADDQPEDYTSENPDNTTTEDDNTEGNNLDLDPEDGSVEPNENNNENQDGGQEGEENNNDLDLDPDSEDTEDPEPEDYTSENPDNASGEEDNNTEDDGASIEGENEDNMDLDPDTSEDSEPEDYTGEDPDNVESDSSSDTSEEEKTTDEKIKDLENEIFKDLTPEELAIKNKELLDNYRDLYDIISDSIEKINKITKSEDNLQVIKFCITKLAQLKEMINHIITINFPKRTYIENLTTFNQAIAVLNEIRKLIDQIKCSEED